MLWFSNPQKIDEQRELTQPLNFIDCHLKAVLLESYRGKATGGVSGMIQMLTFGAGRFWLAGVTVCGTITGYFED